MAQEGAIAPTEPYYAPRDEKEVGGKDLSDEEERRRRHALLQSPVGTPIAIATAANDPTEDLFAATQDEARCDALVLATAGVDSLYAAALLARAGQRVVVLCTAADASGCVSASASDDPATIVARWDGVPFDVASNDLSNVTRQQRLLAPALASGTDAQGGIRFAQVGSAADGYAHTVLSIPGVGTDGRSDAVPFVLHAGGAASIAAEAAATLGDGHDLDSSSASAQYLKFCDVVNDAAAHYYLGKLLPDEVNNLRSAEAYQTAGIRYAAGYLNKLVPLNGHVRSLLAGMGCRDENLVPAAQSMAAHVSNVGALCSPEGMCYPVGGPRALCKALESVIVQNGGRVLTGVSLKEFIFEEEDDKEEEKEKTAKTKEADGDDDDKKKKDDAKKKDPAPQCIGVVLGDGREVRVREDGAVVSMLGFIPTFAHLLNPDVRTRHGVPRGLPALSERRPLLKILIGLNGTADDLSITGADWYRLPNASRAFDERDPLTGEVKPGEIGMGPGSGEADGDGAAEDSVVAAVESSETGEGTDNAAARRGKHSKKSTSGRRNKFDTGVSWIKISFPSAKDPSWEDRYGDISTCVVTIEADDDFVTKFDSKPAIFSNHNKVGADIAQRLMQRVLKDVLQTYPQLEGKIAFSKLVGPVRAGLSHNPERFAAKGIRPKTLYPGLYVGGSDLTVGDSLSGSIVGGWLAANAVMDYNFIDYLFLEKHIVSDLALFMQTSRRSGEDDVAVPFTPKPENHKILPKDDQEKPSGGEDSAPAESSKEE